ncbi:hypothetical protein [Bacillus sp. JJ1562]|uniref:hypothetical protein n=1 Tax=Bacillus sp. JJ1562 TaxID=3122960 RepID=UPI0030038430
MNSFKSENGIVEIWGDEEVVARTENEDLSNVDVSEYRVDADVLARVYEDAVQRREDVEIAKKYVVLKQKYIETFSAE